ncbi:MAG TPA: polysaccharide deacetylase family protein [Pseudobacteroides sp.]|uniref:polysaccharide deacetylase family protein n=1 Tax=Pseudobacteroides sp. TaxID=1968840 RepID=UPI002F94C7DE
MKKMLISKLFLLLSIIVLLSGCGKVNEPDGNIVNSPQKDMTDQQKPSTIPTPMPSVAPTQIDLEKVKPNEMGKIMVVMFHNFVESFTPSKWDKGEYTTTFSSFEKLLGELYEKGYRLISLDDYLNNNINVPAGTIPMVFTFDDGTDGQFSLVKEGDKLVANKKSAVGIIEEFNKTHPDFGLKGTFFVNLGGETFKGEGTLPERLQYLIDKGFDIGNHTMNHAHLNEIKTAEKINEEIGGNQKKMLELIPGYNFKFFSLPFGQASKNLKEHVVRGQYQGVSYDNKIIVEVGWDPAHSPVSKNFDPLSTHRVRSSGIKPVDADLEWWLKNMSRSEQYVSDGNPQTVTVPEVKKDGVNLDSLKDKKFITY